MQQLNTLQAVILGIVQGLTEFLPVSSSGHLILVREVLHYPDPGKTFDILLHFGTLAALVVFFYHDLAEIAGGVLEGFRKKQFYGTPKLNLFWFLIVSTIPGGLFGALFNDKLESINSVYIISGLLISFGFLLFWADKSGKREFQLDHFTMKDAVIIGLAQGLALFPGVSRSGITMTAALFLGYTREAAARYSFLISIPLIGGISAYGLIKLIKSGPDTAMVLVLAAGFLASVISGFLCIKFLLDYLKKGTFLWFAIYRAVMGAVLIVMGLMGLIKG